MTRSQPNKKDPLGSPKGMHDILGDAYFDYQGFFEKAADVALYYGFQPIETPILEKEDVFARTQEEGSELIEKEMYSLRTKGGDRLALRPEGTASVMRAYIEHGMNALPQPVLLFYYGQFFRHENPQHGRLRELRQFGVECLGTQKSVADALVIKTVLAILEEAGVKDTVVEVNSIGDKTCRNAFVRNLTTYYKRHINDICPDCRQRIKTNPLRLLDCKNVKCQEIKTNAPVPLGDLCTECRRHFKEVLEYLEALAIPYRVNGHLVRGLDYYTKTVFEVFSEENEPEQEAGEEKEPQKDVTPSPAPLAIGSGGRFDELGVALGSRKPIPAIGGAIGVDRVLGLPHKRLAPRVLKKPKVYFIQLGFEAKLKSLAVIDILRKCRIPIVQALAKDGLSAQLSHAEKLGVPYTIIFGQKEAIEDSVIVRAMADRSQETVKIGDLGNYLKEL